MDLFFQEELRDVLKERLEDMKQEIHNEKETTILHVDKEEYLDYLVSNYSIDNLNIAFDEMYATTEEREIPGERHPRSFAFRDKNKSYKRTVYTYRIPFSGNKRLLRCRPSKYTTSTVDAQIREGEIQFDIIDFRNDPEELNRRSDQHKSTIRTLADNVIEDVMYESAQLVKIQSSC